MDIVEKVSYQMQDSYGVVGLQLYPYASKKFVRNKENFTKEVRHSRKNTMLERVDRACPMYPWDRLKCRKAKGGKGKSRQCRKASISNVGRLPWLPESEEEKGRCHKAGL